MKGKPLYVRPLKDQRTKQVCGGTSLLIIIGDDAVNTF